MPKVLISNVHSVKYSPYKVKTKQQPVVSTTSKKTHIDSSIQLPLISLHNTLDDAAKDGDGIVHVFSPYNTLLKELVNFPHINIDKCIDDDYLINPIEAMNMFMEHPLSLLLSLLRPQFRLIDGLTDFGSLDSILKNSYTYSLLNYIKNKNINAVFLIDKKTNTRLDQMYNLIGEILNIKCFDLKDFNLDIHNTIETSTLNALYIKRKQLHRR